MWGCGCLHPAAQVGTGFLCAATVPRPCSAASTFAACPWLESCPGAGPLASISATCSGRALSAHRTGLPAAGGSGQAPADRIWLRAGTLQPGLFQPRDSSAKMPLSSPQPCSLPAREEWKVMAGQDWLSLLPRAGGQGWACPGCSWPHGAAVAPADPSEGGWRGCIWHGEQGGSLPSHGQLPTAQPCVRAGLCQHGGCLPSVAPLLELGCDGAMHWEQPQSPSPNKREGWLESTALLGALARLLTGAGWGGKDMALPTSPSPRRGWVPLSSQRDLP